MDIWDDEDEAVGQNRLADREWNRMQEGFMNDGYREGITAGKEGALQEGFDEGFATDGVPLGHRVGTLRGLAAGLQAFLAGGPSQSSASPHGDPALIAEVQAIVTGLARLEIGDLMPPDLLAEQHNLEHEQAEAEKQQQSSRSNEVEMEGDTSGGGDSMEEMLAAFASVGTKDSAAAKTRRRLSLCKTFNFDGEQLFYQWEAYSYGEGGADKRLTEERLQPFRDRLHRDLQRDSAANKKRAIGGAGIGTPAKTLTGRSALASRMLAGATPRRDIVVKMEDSPRGAAGGSTTKNRIVPSERTSGLTYRYLQDKLLQKGETLNRRIDEFGSYVKEYYGLDELADPNVAIEKEVYIVGRICDESESKLTESNLVLEPSKASGTAKRIPIRFAPTGFQFHAPPSQGGTTTRTGIGLFPGAIAAFKGITAHGQDGAFFMVKEVLPLPPQKSLKPKVPPPLSFTTVVVCGPYTYDSDLEYQPLAAMLQAVSQIKPQALVLMGPFVDSNHPIIQKGSYEKDVDELFLKKVAVPIRHYIQTQQPDLSVAFMPAVRDLVSFHNVYPQSSVMGPENFRSWKPPQQGTPPWSFLSNPGIFSINGLTFGATSVDVLFHLRRQEVFKSLPGAVQQDAMAGLCRHILDQRSFYPIYPVPLDSSHDVNLDISHSHLLGIPNDSIPDVVVLPSRLKEFSKIVDGTVFINPSYASKFNNPGMLAKVTVNAMLEGAERIAVELIKL
ncbi:DNA-directed DNA polymerase alpha subunit pol12 [Tulasnella sp. 427]|nr:DNA-directed DNA polymerase alpha subunit pol12 [Tulasnella sp. 427]